MAHGGESQDAVGEAGKRRGGEKKKYASWVDNVEERMWVVFGGGWNWIETEGGEREWGEDGGRPMCGCFWGGSGGLAGVAWGPGSWVLAGV